MHENPYRSPATSHEPPRGRPTPEGRAADAALVGLVLGVVTGATAGVVTAICLLCWSAAATSGNVVDQQIDWAITDDMVSGIVAFLVVGGVAGATAGGLLGLALGLLAACGRSAVLRHLQFISCLSSAVVAASLVGFTRLLLGTSRALDTGHVWLVAFVVVSVASAIGGAVLGRRLSKHFAGYEC